MAKINTAVFPIGGLGTRFLPATKAMPKEMLPIIDKPLIQFVVEEARACGIERLVFVTGRQKHAVENHFDHMIELESTLAERGKKDALSSVNEMLGCQVKSSLFGKCDHWDWVMLSGQRGMWCRMTHSPCSWPMTSSTQKSVACNKWSRPMTTTPATT